MNAISPHPQEPNTEPEFVTEADWVPGFWNFLLGLDHDDLIAELVQNDLDQQATRTVISFERDRLVSEGNGKPVEADGWKRLRQIHGAGEKVPAKQGKIGVKNHGLKTAFTIGNEIRLLSDGLGITQTLYARGSNKAPYPGASREPQEAPMAPSKGCRVEINFRTKNLEPQEGEAIVLGAVEEETIDNLFRSACANIPEQFAGIVSPEVAPNYEIVIRHWSLGEARFLFSCTKPRKVTKGIELFRRKCDITGNVESLPSGLKEEAARKLVPLKGRIKDRVPDFYRRGKQFFIEVSWPVDGRGKPQKGVGKFRYPIGYPTSSQEAHTGHGVFFNAPIVSDTKRHGPARNDATNKDLRLACEALLVDIISHRLVQKWGPVALNPLVPSSETNDEKNAVRPLLSTLVKRRAIPTLSWQDALRILTKGKSSKLLSSHHKGGAITGTKELKRYQFVIPTLAKGKSSIHTSLAIVCPKKERQLDPRVDSQIIPLLMDDATDGWCETFISFDQNDAISRLTGKGNSYFSVNPAREKELASPFLVSAYLDVIDESINQDNLDSEEVQSTLLLPNNNGQAVPFDELHFCAQLPLDIPGLHLPPLLDPEISSHKLFRRKSWRRPKYTMTKFLESGVLRDADEKTRKLFWAWLRRNHRHVGLRERSKLADIAIWPDLNKKLCKLTELCEPNSRAMKKALNDVLHRPHAQVRQVSFVSLDKKRKTSIRTIPTTEELEEWLNKRIPKFFIGEVSDSTSMATLEQFEADLTILAKDLCTSRLIKGMDINLPTLAQDGSIRLRTDVVAPKKDIVRLALLGKFLMASPQKTPILDKLTHALAEPTVEMLVNTLEEDGANFEALQSRLHKLLALTKEGDEHRTKVSSMPIIPVNAKPHPPETLALHSSKGDYWGNWKLQVSVRDLSQNAQSQYLDIGVTSATPTIETSRLFFDWLSRENKEFLERHIICVIRHVLHKNGPEVWAPAYTDIPFIPARVGETLRLISLQTSRRRPVFLPDEREITAKILKTDSNVFLVQDRVREIKEPASESFRKLGVRSLREALGEPRQVKGDGIIQEANYDLMKRLETLRSAKFRETFLKRLSELGVDLDLVRRDWHDRISRIGRIVFAQKVQVCYLFHRHDYWMPADAGFDPGTEIFWVKEGQQGTWNSFYEAIAGQLVFKPAARPIDLFALERSLELEIQDPTFGRPNTLGFAENVVENNTEEFPEEESEPGEATLGHSPFEPNPSRNKPSPKPLPTHANPKSHIGSSSDRGNKIEQSNSQTPDLEKEHVELLKTNHYSSHCQMCLCNSTPEVLAPKGSYIQWEEVRRRIVEAHHVDPKSGGGARHAGNLILLCKLHHDNFGRRLTRETITEALQRKKQIKVASFGTKNEGTSKLQGLQTEVLIPDTKETISLFFTTDHVDFWLSKDKWPS